jgi:hypothetical protein
MSSSAYYEQFEQRMQAHTVPYDAHEEREGGRERERERESRAEEGKESGRVV